MSTAILERATFETSRALEYFTEKELKTQIGFDIDYWPVAILRELIDNALDACEGAGIAPEIDIRTDDDCIRVADNGPGIPGEIVRKSLDYLSRTTTKAYYVSPTRGQLGNALKIVYAAPFVTSGSGLVEIETGDEQHRIEITLDRIAQSPDLRHVVNSREAGADSTRLLDAGRNGDSYKRVGNSGTVIKIHWCDSTRLLREPERDFYNTAPTAADLVAGFVAFNPHARFTLDGECYERSLDHWRKWLPSQPTSAHWYTEETLRDLIAGYINLERDGGAARTVREFVAEFRGLSSTAKQKAVTAEWSGKRLHEFVREGDIEPAFVSTLLARMRQASTAPPPNAIGTIGKEHLSAWMSARGIAPDSIRYQRKTGIDGLPYVLEIAFGVNLDDASTRRIVTGLNWSPVIGGSPDATLRTVIQEARLDPHDPVTLVVHIARPRFQFTDKGKTRIAL